MTGSKLICGIDEAGRGPLAGPVAAAAVILPARFSDSLLADSKKLSAKKREIASQAIMNNAIDWSLGWAWPEEIDKINIHKASLLAMQRAFYGIKTKVSCVFVDGLFSPNLPVQTTAVVKGDSKIREIMAASILAKVIRDRWMERYSWIERDYGFERHKGYPTKEHRSICLSKGLSPIHRRSFHIG